MSPRLSKPTKQRIFCNRCRNDTNHTCQGEHKIPGVLLGTSTPAVETFRLWICDGCEQGTFEESIHVLNEEPPPDEEEDYPYEEWERVRIHYHPPRTKLHIRPKHFAQLPVKLANLYQEVLIALNNEAPVLSAVGIRALIEGICADKKIEGQNLESKIDGLSAILQPNIVSGLHSVRFIGNVAAHELTSPTTDELRLSIEICEDVLNFLYELDYKARNIALTQQTKRLFKPKSAS